MIDGDLPILGTTSQPQKLSSTVPHRRFKTFIEAKDMVHLRLVSHASFLLLTNQTEQYQEATKPWNIHDLGDAIGSRP
jgi:hypothetical protein